MTVQLRMALDTRTPPSPAWDEAHVYLDEQHPNPDDDSFAVGCLMVPKPLERKVVDAALTTLPPANGATARGHFHAVDDGRDAQAALASAFAVHAEACEFHAFRWVLERQPARAWSRLERHLHVASLVLEHVCSIARHGVFVEFASGPTISLSDFQRWMQEQPEKRLGAMILHRGAIPMRFPNVELREAHARDSAGLQVADLLLWQQRRLRARQKPRCRSLFELAKVKPVMRWSQDDGPMENAVLARDAPTFVVDRPPPNEALDWQRWSNLLLMIEDVVHRVARLDPSPAQIAHLLPRVRTASASLRGYRGADLNRFRDFLRTFLMLADTLPVCGDAEPVAQAAADAIWVATSMDDLCLVECVMRLDRWIEVRHGNQAQLGWDG